MEIFHIAVDLMVYHPYMHSCSVWPTIQLSLWLVHSNAQTHACVSHICGGLVVYGLHTRDISHTSISTGFDCEHGIGTLAPSGSTML